MNTPSSGTLVKGVDFLAVSNHNNEPASYNIYADGCVGIAFCESEKDLLFNSTKSGKLFLYGQTVRPLEISYSSDFTMEVIYLQPYAIKQLFQIDANELTDTCIDLDFIDRQFTNRLLEANDREERLDIMLDNIYEKQKSPAKKLPDESIKYAMDKMVKESGNVSISDLRSEIYLTERTFERRFLQYVGVTPSQYAKICRFHKALRQLNSNNFKNLTDVAYSAGYTDQPHFIHQFKEFTALTPTEYLKTISRN
jgi:AraC-like DNA-binding protein